MTKEKAMEKVRDEIARIIALASADAMTGNGKGAEHYADQILSTKVGTRTLKELIELQEK